MALLIRAGVFCTGGHTELGARYREQAAVIDFLAKVPCEIDWQPVFPKRDKPGPKLGVHKSVKDPKDEGVTGSGLVGKMRDLLRRHYRGRDCNLDVVVLIDDADCRFFEQGSLQRRTEELERDVRTLTQRPELRFIALLASPEIEAWLLADWEEGFGREYAPIEAQLSRALTSDDMLGKRPWTSIEGFGGPHDPQKGSCTRKLSDEVQRIVKESGQVYSKKQHGPDMLRRIRPEKVAEVCRSVFAPALRELQALARQASS